MAIMSCEHLNSICTEKGIVSISRAAEAVFTSTNRAVFGLGREGVLRCLHPDCAFPSSQNVFVCVHCVHVTCSSINRVARASMHGITQCSNVQEPSGGVTSHLQSHYKTTDHAIFLSLEHSHLYCADCQDFVFNSYLDGAIYRQSRAAQANRMRFTSSTSPLETPVSGVVFGSYEYAGKGRKRRRALSSEAWIPSTRELSRMGEHARVFSLKGSEIRPPVGLVNLGNSCYMNSVLQAFLHAPPLRNFFLADEHKPLCEKRTLADCLACALDRIICDSCFNAKRDADMEENRSLHTHSRLSFLIPHDVLDIIWRNASHLATYAQHDAHEFLIAALNLLNSHCRHTSTLPSARTEKPEPLVLTESEERPDSAATPPSMISKPKASPVSPVMNVRAGPGGDFLRSHSSTELPSHSIIQSLFSGTLQSDVICGVCGNSSSTLEKFYDISLDVDKFVKPPSTRRSRAPSPAATGMHSEIQQGTLTSPATGLLLHSEDRGEGRLKDDRKGQVVATPTQPSIKTSPDGTNGMNDVSQKREVETANTLDECLKRFTEPEVLGSLSKMHCAKCGRRQESMKQMSIRTLPPIVCFHFKRFEQSFANIRRSEMIKIDTPVQFPGDGMDLSQFQTATVLRKRKADAVNDWKALQSVSMSDAQARLLNKMNEDNPSSAHNVRSNREAMYDLFAVVNHNGRIDSGHYTAMIRKKGIWFKCDDEKVTQLPSLDKNIRSKEAYLVFYVQRHPNMQAAEADTL